MFTVVILSSIMGKINVATYHACMFAYQPIEFHITYVNPTALRKAKSVCNFDLSEYNRVKWTKLGI